MPCTHRVSTGDYSMEHDNVRVSELSHYGGFLEELDFVLLRCFGETLECHVHWLSSLSLPHSLLHTAKLTRPKMTCNPARSFVINISSSVQVNIFNDLLNVFSVQVCHPPGLQLSIDIVLSRCWCFIRIFSDINVLFLVLYLEIVIESCISN